MKQIKKQKSRAFGKYVYLIGKDIYGDKYWLEAPSWDCGWYWGFGYLENYTNNNNPSKSKDIVVHTHWDFMIKRNDLPFAEMTVDNNDFETLKSLFEDFYNLKKEAELNEELGKDINEIKIPIIINKILQILEP